MIRLFNSFSVPARTLVVVCFLVPFMSIAQTGGTKNGSTTRKVVGTNEKTVTTSPAGVKEPDVFNYVEQMPAPKFDLNSYLTKNLHYPKEAREENVEGRVIVKFVVNKNGSVGDVQVVRGIGGGCDEEAKRVISKMPKWKPGRQNGKPVKVYYTLPISFKLK